MPKAVKDYKDAQPHLAERCILCNRIFAKKHPKDNRTICNDCADALRKLIEGSKE